MLRKVSQGDLLMQIFKFMSVSKVIVIAFAILVLNVVFASKVFAEVSCPVAENVSLACLGGPCTSEQVFMAPPPCEPPRWWPGILDGFFCGNGEEDGDGTTAFVTNCANECSLSGNCGQGETCITEPRDEYQGTGNGVCIASEAIVVEPPIAAAASVQCAAGQTWVTDPTPYHNGGQCQATEDLVACCYQPDTGSDIVFACRAGVPTECMGNDICSNSGFCYERNQIQPGILKPDLQRDPDVYPAQPGSINRNGYISFSQKEV